MIELHKIFYKIEKEVVFFCAEIKIDGKEIELWYSTEERFKKYISLSNGDSFILPLFIFAVINNLDFKSNVPISKKLNYGLLEVMVPMFKKMKFNTDTDRFKFQSIDNTIFTDAKASGTAMSFGVDSFYAFFKQADTDFPIEYLTLFNAGAFGQQGGEKGRKIFTQMKDKVEKFSLENHLKFLWVDTNINETLKMPFVKTHTFRNFACVFVFQKLFKNYYYASGITLDHFKLNFNDPAYYDLLNTKAISGNTLEFYISGLNETRFEKTTYISNHNMTTNYLNVCLLTSDNINLSNENMSFKNCSKCYKCIRTMVSLDVVGRLELYNNVFDLKVFKRNKEKYIAEILYFKFRSKNMFSCEILKEMKLYDYTYSSKVYLYLIKRFFQPIIKRINND